MTSPPTALGLGCPPVRHLLAALSSALRALEDRTGVFSCHLRAGRAEKKVNINGTNPPKIAA